MRRVLCDLRSEAPGPTLLCIAGVHGNEPAGVRALERVTEAVSAAGGPARGRFVAVLGNLAALERGERWVDRDLNRGWPVRGAHRPAPHAAAAEDGEQRELRLQLERAIEGSPGGVVVLDLHTTSSHGPPFTLIGDTLPNRAFAAHLRLPIVLGLEELLDGTLLDFLHPRVGIAVGVEGGQHDDPASADLLEAVVLRAMEALAMRDEARPMEGAVGRPGEEGAATSGAEAPGAMASGPGLPPKADASARFLEVRYRRQVDPPVDGFRMRPGYRNFQRVGEGEIVARDHAGPIRVPERGRLLMPLYQKLGEDGFFVVRPIRPVWIRLSGALRRAGVDRWVHLMPGVRPLPSRPGAYAVNRRVARWYALEVFHLLGYRKARVRGDTLVVTRR